MSEEKRTEGGGARTSWIHWLLRIALVGFGTWMLYLVGSGRVRRIGDPERIPLQGAASVVRPTPQEGQP